MGHFIAGCQKSRLDNGWILCLHNQHDTAPFSWGRYIVISVEDYSSGAQSIITHETMHLECRHWADLLLAEAVALLTWYNPVGWLMRNELQTIHEYEADEAVLLSGINAKEYQLLLIKKAVGARFPSIANSLDHSNLSKRIKMMLRKKSSPGNRWLAIAALPAVALCALVLMNPVVTKALDKVTDAKVTESISITQTDENVDAADSRTEVFTMAEQMPKYPGGEIAMMNFLMENMNYPKEAMDKNIQGRVIVKFVIEKDGSVGEVNVIRGVDPLLDAEAIRVVKSMPKFEPGKVDGKPVAVWYTLPLTFKLKGDDKSTTESTKQN